VENIIPPAPPLPPLPPPVSVPETIEVKQITDAGEMLPTPAFPILMFTIRGSIEVTNEYTIEDIVTDLKATKSELSKVCSDVELHYGAPNSIL
jgi:hypothetical protein